MIDMRATRLLAVLVLIVGQWGLGVWFATSDQESTIDRLTEAEQVGTTSDLVGRSSSPALSWELTPLRSACPDRETPVI